MVRSNNYPGSRSSANRGLFTVRKASEPTKSKTTLRHPGEKTGPTSVPSMGKVQADHLLTYCWCTRRMVKVAKTEIAAGRTVSCGKKTCHE